MKKGIYTVRFDCGRMGELTGTFVSTDVHVNMLVSSGIEVYFGEVLGKHSEIWGSVNPDEISLKSDDPSAVLTFEELGLESGINPFGYMSIHFEHEAFEDLDDVCVGEIIEKLVELETINK